MAYNLQSLTTILQQILNPEQSRWIRFRNIPELQSLLEKAESLQQILEKSSPSKIKKLENQIRDAAHKAEDIIEPLIVDQMLSLPRGIRFILLEPVVQQVTQELDYIMKQVVQLVEGNKMSSGSSSSASGTSFSSSKSVVVGVDDDLMQMKDRLTGMERKLEIIPIVGMGGIGKTTLARNLYQDPLIVEHFEFIAWTTISQDYNMKTILSSLVRCIVGNKEFDDEHIQRESDELRDVLYRSLYGRRYMIVLDDIWSTKFWDEIRVYLPDNNNGSRIMITTRESDVAKCVDSQEHQVHLLNQSKSWDLLRQIVFGEKDWHDDVLQGIGKKIASDCGGLPLAINVIGGVMSKVERSRAVWENIGNDVRAAIVESDEQFSNILSLSYNHLPNHLKPCFLYMGAFPEDYEIKGSRLVRMWVAEGFVKVNGDKSLEEEAEDYLKALVERNLLLVNELKRNGKPKKRRYIMHDLLRDLCINKANEEKFLYVKHASNVVSAPNNLRRVSFHASYRPNCVYDSRGLIPHVRSFMSTGTEILSPVFFAFRLLRVLHIPEMKFEEFPREVLQLVNLRYLAIGCESCLPIGISRLCNLQTLIAHLAWGSGGMPREIWEMSELRHVQLGALVFFEEDEMITKHVLKKLQRLSKVAITASPMWKEFFQRFPNIKHLEIYYDEKSVRALDLSHLHKLEKLKCDIQFHCVLSTLRFPSSLRSLTLKTVTLCSRDMSTLCDLPNLEALIISNCTFEIKDEKDEEWELTEDDEFCSLQFLHLHVVNLVHWRAAEINFPTLRHLSLVDCRDLEEIPGGIGEIPTLHLIELYLCSASAVASARQIQEVQQSDYDNYDLQLRIRDHERSQNMTVRLLGPGKRERERFRKMIYERFGC